MAGTLIVSTIGDGNSSKPVADLLSARIAARVSFAGNTTPISIYDSENVSSITDLGVGYYQINFAKPMPNLYYTTVGTAQRTGNYSDIPLSIKSGNSLAQSTTQVPIVAYDVGGSVIDPLLVSVAIIT